MRSSSFVASSLATPLLLVLASSGCGESTSGTGSEPAAQAVAPGVPPAGNGSTIGTAPLTPNPSVGGTMPAVPPAPEETVPGPTDPSPMPNPSDPAAPVGTPSPGTSTTATAEPVIPAGRGGEPGAGGNSNPNVAGGGNPNAAGMPNTGGSANPNTGGGAQSEAGSGGIPENGSGGNPGTLIPGDRCDVALYDPAAPPETLSLSGNLGAHDPVVMEQDGTFYLFMTGNQIAAKTSTNLTNWNGAQEVYNQIDRPSWIASEVPGVSNLWAPDISYFGGQYHLYYSASTFGENTSCLGHLTRSRLDSGQWSAENQPTFCSSGSDDYNAIDPNVVLDEDGTPWLSFGSFWDGIFAFELDDQGARVGTEVHALASRGGQGIEAPFIVRRCGYYYLFVSWDSCCQGANSTYNMRVGRSANVLGPYEDREGTPLLDGGGTLLVEGDDQWRGPGHNAILFSGDKAYNVHHAYRASNGAAELRISEIAWDEAGWPISAGP